MALKHIADMQSKFLDGDFARNNLFEVEILRLGTDMTYKAESTSLPAFKIGKIPVKYMGKNMNVAGDRDYDDWVVSFYNDADHTVREALKEWQYECQATGGEVYGATPAEYKSFATIRQFRRDTDKGSSKEYTVIGIFPIEVGEVSLGWDNNNQIQKFDVVFAVDYVE